MRRKSMRSRGIPFLLAAALLCGVLAGCGGKEESPAEVEEPVGCYDEEEGADDAANEETREEAGEISCDVTPDGGYEDACDEAEEESAVEESAGCDAINSQQSAKRSKAEDETFSGYCPVGEPGWESGEAYEKEDENGFCLTVSQPLSTFSANVDTASYANVRRMIEAGCGIEDIDPAAVRAEEFINYFSYQLKLPRKGELFGVTTEVSACPWNKEHSLMMVGMRTKALDMSEAPDSNLVFLLDVSGSMADEDKLPLLQKSFRELVNGLDHKDRVSIVTYASGVETVCEGVRGDQKEEINRAIDSLYAAGGTNGEDGIQQAYRMAEANFIKGGNNRVILATDGDLNIGVSEPEQLKRLIADKRESGVYLSVLGFGTGNIKDNNMAALADNGNGNYAYIDSVFEAKKVLVEELGATLMTVAGDVKLQVEFNPENVNAYRLIGYENKMLAASDFNDDTKDAGEIGAGHMVVALYEIIPAGSRDGTDLKYRRTEEVPQKKSGTKYADEFATVSVRYKEPGKDKSKLVSYVVDKKDAVSCPSDDFVFASLAAEFAMILSDSPNKGDATLEGILETYKTLEPDDEYKEEFYYLVKQMAKR